MKLSEIKEILKSSQTLNIRQIDGQLVPAHFHVTEVGKVSKHFIDCGGTIRKEEVVNFQLWNADDYDHRLHPEILLAIIELSEQKLEIPDLEIEVEYQTETIGKFGLQYDGKDLQLTATLTDCLAKDKCGIPEEKPRIKLTDLSSGAGETCTPGGGCC